MTEFIFRHEPSKDAVVYMSLERPTTQESAEEDSRALLDDLRKIEVPRAPPSPPPSRPRRRPGLPTATPTSAAPRQVHGSDVTANEMAKTHARYLAGALPWRERRGGGAAEACG